MLHRLELSELQYKRLEQTKDVLGLQTIEAVIDHLLEQQTAAQARAESVKRIHQLRAYLHEKYGDSPDSVELIREDRERCRIRA
jgi:hypothetical protein